MHKAQICSLLRFAIQPQLGNIWVMSTYLHNAECNPASTEVFRDYSFTICLYCQPLNYKMSFFHSFLRGTFCFVALPAIGFTALQFSKAEDIKNEAVKTPRIAIIGSGIGGSATAHFVREILGDNAQISVFEKADRIGGRLATVDFAGDTFESGGSIIHPKNLYMRKFVELLGMVYTLHLPSGVRAVPFRECEGSRTPSLVGKFIKRTDLSGNYVTTTWKRG